MSARTTIRLPDEHVALNEKHWLDLKLGSNSTYQKLRTRFTQKQIDFIKGKYYYFHITYEECIKQIEDEILKSVRIWQNSPHHTPTLIEIEEFRASLNTDPNS